MKGDDHDDHLESRFSTMMTILFGRKLEVVHKQVGGYLTRCARDAASIALNYESSVSQSVTCAGIELLSQLKKSPKCTYQRGAKSQI